jgi:hypothetical protein
MEGGMEGVYSLGTWITSRFVIDTPFLLMLRGGIVLDFYRTFLHVLGNTETKG